MLLSSYFNQRIFVFNGMYAYMPDEIDKPVEGDRTDEDDEDFDDQAENTEDLAEIHEADPDIDVHPDEDDHLPEDDLQ